MPVYNTDKVSCKSILKSFFNGLYKCKIPEKQCSWPSRLPGIANYFELKGGIPVHTQTKIKISFETLPVKF